MAAISYVIGLGQTLEQVTSGTAVPTSGSVEIRFDQTTTAITDKSVTGGTRALKKGEIYTLLQILEEKLVNDSTVAQ